MWILLQAGAAQAPRLQHADLPGGYGVALLQTLLALAAVCVLAWVVLRWSAQRGFGALGHKGVVQVIERVPLDARRAIYVVRIGDRVLAVGVGDGAAPSVLTELDPASVPKAEDVRVRFADLWKKTRKTESGG